MKKTTWGSVARFSYGRSLPPDAKRDGTSQIFGTNGPTGWTGACMGTGPTVVIGRKGAYRGVHLASKAFWVIDTAFYMEPGPTINPIWAYYCLKQYDINAMDAGSAIPSTRRQDLEALPLDLPDLATQTAIADVLGALDDKIAANERANSIASALSQSLLVRASDSVPLVPLGQLVDVPRNTVTPVPGGVWHFSLPAFDEGEVPKMEDGAEIKSAKQRLDQPAVLLSKLNPRIPRVWDVATIPEVHPALASTEFIVLEPHSASTAELTAALRLPASLDGLQSLARGTSGSHQRVSPADAMALEIPDVTQLHAALRRTLTVLAAATARRRTESARLAATRDALLPELMSGRLTVSSVLEDA